MDSENHSSCRASLSTTLLLLVAHLMAWVPLTYLLFRVVPRFKLIFMDFGIKLPWATEMVLSLSDWLEESYYLVPLPLVLLALLDGAILHVLRKKRGTTMLAWLWFVLVIAAALASTLLVYDGLWGPMFQLMDGLAM